MTFYFCVRCSHINTLTILVYIPYYSVLLFRIIHGTQPDTKTTLAEKYLKSETTPFPLSRIHQNAHFREKIIEKRLAAPHTTVFFVDVHVYTHARFSPHLFFPYTRMNCIERNDIFSCDCC